MSEYDDVIGRLANEDEITEAVEKAKPAAGAAGIHPLVSIEQLERPSPKPFSGRPDPDFPDLDSGEPLYIPRFLVRKWGVDKFRRSAYYTRWASEAGRSKLLGIDAKPSGKKK